MNLGAHALSCLLLLWAPTGETGGDTGGEATAAGADAGAADTGESSWWSSNWETVLIVAIVVVLLAALIYAIVVWRRKRAEATPEDRSSTAGRLRRIWSPFYDHIPVEAEHYPTFVVMGEAGAGKSTLVRDMIKPRNGEISKLPSPDDDEILQLYLGSEVIVHELSAQLLRDSSRSTKRGLTNMWRELGPGATVILVLDADSVHSSQLEDLARNVRDKISLMPSRIRDTLELRVYISHLDSDEQLRPGYLNFTSLLGRHHPALSLSDDPSTRFDAHLASGLVQFDGAGFDALVYFYAYLRELLLALDPMVTQLRGGARETNYAVEELYLGSTLPKSYVGDPFVVNTQVIDDSISEHARRHRRISTALGASLCLASLALTLWHGNKVFTASEAIETFEAEQDDDAGASSTEAGHANKVRIALEENERSEILWMKRAFVPQKEHLYDDFADTIYRGYLEPKFRDQDADGYVSRVRLFYLLSLIYATPDSPLGALIIEDKQYWADQLQLPAWVIEYFLETDRRGSERAFVVPACIDSPGTMWVRYLQNVEHALARDRLTQPEFRALRVDMPGLYSTDEYMVLGEVRALMLQEKLSTGVQAIFEQDLDPWGQSEYEQLLRLKGALDRVDVRARRTSTWGLATLVEELGRVEGPSGPLGFEVQLTKDEQVLTSITSEALDKLVLRSKRHELINAVLERQSDAWMRDGASNFFDTSYSPADDGVVSGYGGGPRDRIRGIYTKASFQHDVTDTLEFANAQLVDALWVGEDGDLELDEGTGDGAEADAATADADPGDGEPVRLEMTGSDRHMLADAIRTAATTYAQDYKAELVNYYSSFSFDPGSEIALPYAIKPFSQPNSWFSSFLLAVSRNLALEYPAEDPGEFFVAQERALESLDKLALLLAEDNGQLPGLEPYQALIAALHKEVAAAVDETGDPEASELIGRLSTIGAFALGVKNGINLDYESLVSDWLFGAQVDPEWYGPFLAPVQQVERYGLLDVQAKLATAWKTDVRPIALPLLDLYPFDASSLEDIQPNDLEQAFRAQGEIPGTFWDAFERLVRPALRDDKKEKITMLNGIRPPGGMLAMSRDLERLTNTLWDEKGERVPLSVDVQFGLLPMEPYNERYPSIASLASGGDSIYGFNQRALTQTLRYEWWEQGMSTVTLTLELPGVDLDKNCSENCEQSVSYRLSAEGEFSFFRLLDKAEGISVQTNKNSVTQIAMYRGTICDRRGPQRTRRVQLAWSVPLGRYGAKHIDVSATIISDAWEPFAIRSCQ